MAAARSPRLRSHRVYDGCRRCGGTARGAHGLERRLAAVHGRDPANDRVLKPRGEPFPQQSVRRGGVARAKLAAGNRLPACGRVRRQGPTTLDKHKRLPGQQWLIQKGTDSSGLYPSLTLHTSSSHE